MKTPVLVALLLALAGAAAVEGAEGSPADVVVGPNPFYYAHWCNASYLNRHALEFLDDRLCRKLFPGSRDRDWQCAASWDPPLAAADGTAADGNGWAADGPYHAIRVRTTPFAEVPVLNGTVPGVELVIVAVRRGSDGVVRYKYAGTPGARIPLQPWSSTKVFAMANAAGRLREQCAGSGGGGATCGFGGANVTKGKHGPTPLGDLATATVSYDTTAGYTSNALGSYFEDVGGRRRADTLVRQWLTGGQEGKNGESFGGNYGESTPPDLGFMFSNADAFAADKDNDNDASCTCAVTPDHSGVVIPNALSPLSLVEMLRRMVLHRSIAPERRFPGVAWADVQDILYGASKPSLYPAAQAPWGGMSADTAIFAQDALGDLPSRAAHSGGQWRIFSKLGAGFSTSRGGLGEILSIAYACVPLLGARNSGLEFVLAARASVRGDVLLEEAQRRVKAAVDAAVAWVERGAK